MCIGGSEVDKQQSVSSETDEPSVPRFLLILPSEAKLSINMDISFTYLLGYLGHPIKF